MMEKKGLDSSDTDDSDFEIDLYQGSSDESLQSEYESKTTKNNYSKKKGKSIFNQNNQLYEKNKCILDKNQKIQNISTISIDNSKNKLSPNEEKARADSLWKNFLNDTASSSKTRLNNTTSSLSVNTTKLSMDSSNDMNKKHIPYSDIVNLEETLHTKSIVVNEIIKNNNIPLLESKKNGNKFTTSSQFCIQENDLKKRHISSMLHNIKKKPKLTTLEKSKLDWNNFKEEHNLEEEISHYNRGKSGYLEKQDFLQRTDSRQFEIEKKLRNIGKRKTR